MNQITPIRAFDRADQQGRRRKSAVKRIAPIILVPAALAALAVGFRLGQEGWPLPAWVPAPVASVIGGSAPTPTGPIAYYRDPTGKPFYAAAPKKTEDGRDYRPVPVGEDVSFEEKPKDTAAEGSAGAGGKRILYYRNPMGLPDTSPVPKKDSMGMDYLPVYEGEAEDGSTVKISPGRLQRTGVRSEIVERRVVTRPVRVPGTIKLDERRIAVISLRSEGFVEKVENVTTGDRVRMGQSLFRLYSPEIAAASAQYLSVVNEGGSTGIRPLVLEGARRRLENLNVPPEVISEIERTRKVPTTITWSAPREGVVLERNAIEGARAMPGDVLFRIADISTLWVLADVPEHDLGAVRPGQTVTIRLRSLPGQVFQGKIGLIYPQLNPETRTARVRIEIANPSGLLLPDMYADVEVATGADKPVVAVPDSALIDTGTRQVVIIDKGEGRFEPREVKVGDRGAGFVEIRDGVVQGDQVVVSANFLIDAESNLKAALQSMAASTEEKAQ
ncbi:efflux RND transporter periplasmic adaptor subunit [Microvirga sp. VF16]|uniref:efflux RND transporter periplasmic adaptor subunit n=1 Tax=Microvirga sp. VF16 TaxID=2807101 RepID=UPI00193CD85D|nr:efflux RND transporter periplasmic adaptor subunit [Microvirga sp. VF16]QRM34675.1 efflux RND transporter periplasmic adaptor subunit [Microvirga sp. VF16]